MHFSSHKRVYEQTGRVDLKNLFQSSQKCNDSTDKVKQGKVSNEQVGDHHKLSKAILMKLLLIPFVLSSRKPLVSFSSPPISSRRLFVYLAQILSSDVQMLIKSEGANMTDSIITCEFEEEFTREVCFIPNTKVEMYRIVMQLCTIQ